MYETFTYTNGDFGMNLQHMRTDIRQYISRSFCHMLHSPYSDHMCHYSVYRKIYPHILQMERKIIPHYATNSTNSIYKRYQVFKVLSILLTSLLIFFSENTLMISIFFDYFIFECKIEERKRMNIINGIKNVKSRVGQTH